MADNTQYLSAPYSPGGDTEWAVQGIRNEEDRMVLELTAIDEEGVAAYSISEDGTVLALDEDGDVLFDVEDEDLIEAVGRAQDYVNTDLRTGLDDAMDAQVPSLDPQDMDFSDVEEPALDQSVEELRAVEVEDHDEASHDSPSW